MTSENWALGAFTVVMLLFGAISWRISMGPEIPVDVSPLDDFPLELAGWRSASNIPVEPAIAQELAADFNIQRAYTTRAGGLVWLYVGYYGTDRGGRPSHTPRGCYTSAGWGISSSRVVEAANGSGWRANEYRVDRGEESRLVHFWYRSYRRTGLLGGLDQNLDRMWGRLVNGRADGALVRLSTPIRAGDTAAARGRLMALASQVDPALALHWPREEVCDGWFLFGCDRSREATRAAFVSTGARNGLR